MCIIIMIVFIIRNKILFKQIPVKLTIFKVNFKKYFSIHVRKKDTSKRKKKKRENSECKDLIANLKHLKIIIFKTFNG